MDDQSLNREIESALNVDPSPEFLARVRTRIAGEPEPSRWRLALDSLALARGAWVMVPVAAASVVILGALTEMRPRPEPAAPVQAVTSPSTPLGTGPAPVAARPPIIEPGPTVRGGRLQADRTAPRVGPALPEVLVSADEQRALEFVAVIVSRGRIEDLSVERADTDIENVTLRDVEMAPITGLDPVVIRPLQIASVEGERQ